MVPRQNFTAVSVHCGLSNYLIYHEKYRRKVQDLELVDNTQQAVKQQISRITVLSEGPEVLGEKTTKAKSHI